MMFFDVVSIHSSTMSSDNEAAAPAAVAETMTEETRKFALVSSVPLAAVPPTRDDVLNSQRRHSNLNDSRFIESQRAVCAAKTGLDGIPERSYYYSRDKVFPLSHRGVNDKHANFKNRAGYKLEQCLAAVDMWLHVLRDGDPAKKPRKKVVFVDVCGGPGAFSQTLYNNKPKYTKMEGFGMTLMDSHVNAPKGWYPDLPKRNGFTPTFGVDGTGNIYVPGNIEAMFSLVADREVRLVVADGGFEVPPSQQNMQEAVSAQIVYAQWYAALRMLCPGGGFVLKLFDTFTPFSRSMLLLTCHFFDAVYVVKPLHSRVVNSERYLSCTGFRGVPPAWMEYFVDVHAHGFTESEAPLTLMPLAAIAADGAFMAGMDAMVSSIAERQCRSLDLVTSSPFISGPPEPRMAPRPDVAADAPAEAAAAAQPDAAPPVEVAPQVEVAVATE
jgi:cap1 methyltransferase